MTKCANCGKELKWYQVAHPMLSREPFCQGLKCWKEYNKKKEEGLIKAEDKKQEDSLSRGIKFAVGIILVIILFFWLFQPRLEIKGEIKPIVNNQNNYVPETSNPPVAPQTTSTNTASEITDTTNSNSNCPDLSSYPFKIGNHYDYDNSWIVTFPKSFKSGDYEVNVDTIIAGGGPDKSPIFCSGGSGQGENINYIYCSGITIRHLDKNGNILGNGEINLVIDSRTNQSVSIMCSFS